MNAINWKKLLLPNISDCQKDRQKRRGKPQETGVS